MGTDKRRDWIALLHSFNLIRDNPFHPWLKFFGFSNKEEPLWGQSSHCNIFSSSLHRCDMVSLSFPCLINRLTDRSCPIPSRSAIQMLLALVWRLIRIAIATFRVSPFLAFSCSSFPSGIFHSRRPVHTIFSAVVSSCFCNAGPLWLPFDFRTFAHLSSKAQRQSITDWRH